MKSLAKARAAGVSFLILTSGVVGGCYEGLDELPPDLPATDETGDGMDLPTTEYDTVSIQLSATGAMDPFATTEEIEVSVTFLEDCLEPHVQQEGETPDAILQSWVPKLCDPAQFPGVAGCSVTSIDEGLDERFGRIVLSVVYSITDKALNQKILPVGPLPTSLVTGCTPSVGVTPAGIRGNDANGASAWRITEVSSSSALVGQSEPVVVSIVPIGG